MQEALGLKVSQFMGLMGDKSESEHERYENANFARKHAERLIAQMTAP
jgi:hypothetical protein